MSVLGFSLVATGLVMSAGRARPYGSMEVRETTQVGRSMITSTRVRIVNPGLQNFRCDVMGGGCSVNSLQSSIVPALSARTFSIDVSLGASAIVDGVYGGEPIRFLVPNPQKLETK